MDPFVDQNFEQREETRAALTQKLEMLESRIRENVENVREAIRHSTDVRYRVNKHPWGMFGLSVAVGCIVGRLSTCGVKTHAGDNGSHWRAPIGDEGGLAIPINNKLNGNIDQYAQQVSVIKGATIGAIASILTELARYAVPTLLGQLENYTQGKIDSLPNKVSEPTGSETVRLN